MVKVGIITVTYNSSHVIDDFLNSLILQQYQNWQLYIVDSASTDDTLQKFARFHSEKIIILPQNKNIGFAAGNNLGIARAITNGCNELLLINNDTIFSPDFLIKLLQSRKEHPYAVLTPKIFYPDGKTLWCAGGGFKPAQAYAAYHRGENEIDAGQYDYDGTCDFVPMCCVLIPVQIWQKVGALDEKFFIYSEDADWFYRAKLCSVQLRYCYQPRLIHKVSSLTGGAQSAIGAFYGSRNRIYFLRKNFSGIHKFRHITIYLLGVWYKLLMQRYKWREFLWRLRGCFYGFFL